MEVAEEEETQFPMRDQNLAKEDQIKEFAQVCEVLRNSIYDLNLRFETGMKKELRKIPVPEMQAQKDQDQVFQLAENTALALTEKQNLIQKVNVINKVN